MEQAIEHLEIIIAKYSRLLNNLEESKFNARPSPDKWSGKEYLGHLIDSAQTNIRRFVVGCYEDEPFIVYDQNKWVAAMDYQNYPLPDLINLWILLNKQLVIILKNISEEDRARQVMTPDLHTLNWLAADYNTHLLHHLHQILKLEPIAYP